MEWAKKIHLAFWKAVLIYGDLVNQETSSWEGA